MLSTKTWIIIGSSVAGAAIISTAIAVPIALVNKNDNDTYEMELLNFDKYFEEKELFSYKNFNKKEFNQFNFKDTSYYKVNKEMNRTTIDADVSQRRNFKSDGIFVKENNKDDEDELDRFKIASKTNYSSTDKGDQELFFIDSSNFFGNSIKVDENGNYDMYHNNLISVVETIVISETIEENLIINSWNKLENKVNEFEYFWNLNLSEEKTVIINFHDYKQSRKLIKSNNEITSDMVVEWLTINQAMDVIYIEENGNIQQSTKWRFEIANSMERYKDDKIKYDKWLNIEKSDLSISNNDEYFWNRDENSSMTLKYNLISEPSEDEERKFWSIHDNMWEKISENTNKKITRSNWRENLLNQISWTME